MTSLREAIDKGRRLDVLKPWPRIAVDQAIWVRVGRELAKSAGDLLGLWSDGVEIHMAVRANDDKAPVVLSLAAVNGRFHAIGQLHAPAQRLERAIKDIYGLTPQGLDDDRRWLDHGVWGLVHPGGDREPSEPNADAYRFLAAEGAPLHQIPVGPVHAGIIEPGHFRFSANGETVVRLEERLGYVHKGIETLLRGADLERAARLAGRVSGDSTVAYAFAFSRAVEQALDIRIPERAKFLRGVMAELERLANHLGDIGAICNDAAFSLMLAHCGVLREKILRAAKVCFGHRLMMDCIVPGGVAHDLTKEGASEIEAMLREIDDALPKLLQIYDSTTSLQDRTVNTGKVSVELVRQFAAGGHVGRASGREFDARVALPYAPYDSLAFDTPLIHEGDVDARVRVRIEEVHQSMRMLRQMLPRLAEGPLRAEFGAPGHVCEGVAMVESFRGDILAWVRIAGDGTIDNCHLRDPSWFQWPLLEAAIEGNIVADFPLCNKSFNCSYSGHDL